MVPRPSLMHQRMAQGLRIVLGDILALCHIETPLLLWILG